MKRLSLFIIIYTVPFVAVFSQIRRNSVYQTYIDLYKDLAIEEMVRHKISASITLAQGLLMAGPGVGYITMMMRETSVSEPMTMCLKVLRTIVCSCQNRTVTPDCSDFQ